jgi:hypothetical protein
MPFPRRLDGAGARAHFSRMFRRSKPLLSGIGKFAVVFTAAGLFLVAPASVVAEDAAPCAAPETPPEEVATLEGWRERIAQSRKCYEAFARQARLELEARAAGRAAARSNPGRLEEFLADDTLQRGDVVVTDKGFRVFGGSAESPAPRDFKPVASGIRRPASRRALDAMERASGFRPAEDQAR